MDGSGRKARGLQNRLWASEIAGIPSGPRPFRYSNAGDKRWQLVVFSGTQRIPVAISERAAVIC